MSAESFLLYYGLRFPIGEDDVEAMEADTHPLQVIAQRTSLDSWWGNFSAGGAEEYYLFIGKQLGMLGAEFSASASIGSAEVQAIFRETETKLKRAGLKERPSLLAQWEPDF